MDSLISIPKDFDALSFEIEREQVFERSLKSEDISFNAKTDYFFAGRSDGYQRFHPEPHQADNADYCLGYLAGARQLLQDSRESLN